MSSHPSSPALVAAQEPSASCQGTSLPSASPRPFQSQKPQQTKKKKMTDFDADIDPTGLSPDEVAAYLGVSRPPTPTFEELLDMQLPPVPRCPIPRLLLDEHALYGAQSKRESAETNPASVEGQETRTASSEGDDSAEDQQYAQSTESILPSPFPRNLLYPRQHHELSRIEQITPGHEVRIARYTLGAHSQFGAFITATAFGGYAPWLRDNVRRWLRSEKWRAGFEAAAGREAYKTYMKRIAEPSWWGDMHSLRVLRLDMCYPIVVASRDEAGKLRVDWADEADREKFEKGELDEVVLGIWREGNIHEVMY